MITRPPQKTLTEAEKADGLRLIADNWETMGEFTKWRIYWILCHGNIFKFLATFIELNFDKYGWQILVAVEFVVIFWLAVLR